VLAHFRQQPESAQLRELVHEIDQLRATS
jgi:hypothetical protein